MDKPWGAPIVSFEYFNELRPTLGKVVVISGGFDPIHPGHISYMIEAKKLGDTLAVIVNGDAFLTTKKGKPFQPLENRCQIVSAIRNVDYVLPFEIKNDQTVIKALELIKPDIFAKAGDRYNAETIPEWDNCRQLGIKIITNVGEEKKWSSSQFLNDWSQFKNTSSFQ
jgi:D-beta-D-heptose 7-phosphate kinase/D-beta-D-heptose 1-phosphate adenosyltransferase